MRGNIILDGDYTDNKIINRDSVQFFSEIIDSIRDNQKYIESQTQWQAFFLKTEPCAFCPAWRVCLGKFSSTHEQNPGCKDFFPDLMDASDFYRDLKKKEERELCQL